MTYLNINNILLQYGTSSQAYNGKIVAALIIGSIIFFIYRRKNK
jgi:hypothetical protein